MSRIVKQWMVLSLSCLVTAVFGCDSLPNPAESDDAKPAPSAHTHTGHHHSETGPHQGQLVELGGDEYHAELVHSEDEGTVTIHLLDAGAKESVTSDAQEITINIRKGDEPMQFKLAAGSGGEQPQEAVYSAYTLASQELLELLEDESVTAKLNVTINGQPFSGELPHLDHDGHEHTDHRH